MKKVAILGSTGSIGTQTLDVIRENRENFKITALTCGSNIELMINQIKEFEPEMVAVAKEEDAKRLQMEFPSLDVHYGEEGQITAAVSDCDVLLNSVMGMRGLVPTYRAIENGTDIALANKETLVAGGQVIMDQVAKHNVKMLPVDSEHSAIFQCLQGNEGKGISKILLTASGGPFRGYTIEQLEQVTLAQALKHPKWTMGKKITIDSATMMNKGLEVIEAKWLFDIDVRKIEILVHPQSILHSAVEFEDKSVIGQMGVPDMRIPISFAMSYPERTFNPREGVDFFGKAANLTFHKPNPEVFRCIKIAYDSSEAGGTYPVVMNAANEVLVDLFLNKKIRFIDIQNNLERILDAHKPAYNLDLEGILEADRLAREATLRLCGGAS